MIYRTAPPRHQRLAVLAAVLAIHAGLILFFLLQRSVMTKPEVDPASIAMIALDAERPAAAEPPPPTLPAKLAETFEPVIELSVPADAKSDAPAGASATCSTLDVVLKAILLDPVALAAVRGAPPEARSVAEAIMMWNGGWSPVAQTPDAPLGAVRANVERSLATIADACLDEPVTGPRLMLIPDATGERSMILAIGSGDWTWRALLMPTLAPPNADRVAPSTVR